MTLFPRIHRRSLRAALTLSVLWAFGASDARAEAHLYQVPASSGHAWPNADENCFEHSWTVMTNNCSTSKRLVFAPPVMADLVSVFVYVYGSASSASPISCQAFAHSKQLGSIVFTPNKAALGFGPYWQLLSLGSLNVSKDHALQIECNMGAGASVSQVMIREAF
jgi:hypothetical protein